jgi:hypothetical protein
MLIYTYPGLPKWVHSAAPNELTSRFCACGCSGVRFQKVSSFGGQKRRMNSGAFEFMRRKVSSCGEELSSFGGPPEFIRRKTEFIRPRNSSKWVHSATKWVHSAEIEFIRRMSSFGGITEFIRRNHINNPLVLIKKLSSFSGIIIFPPNELSKNNFENILLKPPSKRHRLGFGSGDFC